MLGNINVSQIDENSDNIYFPYTLLFISILQVKKRLAKLSGALNGNALPCILRES